MKEHRSTIILACISGGAFLGGKIFYPWGALIGGILGFLVGSDYHILYHWKKNLKNQNS